jgi:metal-responsive CopG/Arc/MetJ family transcriptional regulator
MARIDPQNDKPAAGKNISVYLNKELLSLVESTGRPPSQLIQDALRQYFIDADRKKAVQKVVKIAQSLGKSDRLAEAISEWQHERENDRWSV